MEYNRNMHEQPVFFRLHVLLDPIKYRNSENINKVEELEFVTYFFIDF